MKVLALASYPVQAAATRYRLTQFVEPLTDRGIEMTIRPFLDERLFKSLYTKSAVLLTTIGLVKATFRRLLDVVAASRADVVLVQREAMLFGPPIVEWLVSKMLRRPMVLDLDDATYIAYSSPTYGSLGKVLKWFSKTDDLIRWARIVTCGNTAIGEYVTSKRAEARIVPTVVNTDVFRPSERSKDADKVVLGWVGTHSTFPYLESIFPVLQELATNHRFSLKIVGSGRQVVTVPGVEIENLEWKMDRELEDFQSLSVGLYPIAPTPGTDEWAAGKSGFKSIQYMAVGIPYVASPVGAVKEIGEDGKTHFCASTPEEWRTALLSLIEDAELRQRMGQAGRAHVVEHFGLGVQTQKLADALTDAMTRLA
jgi:glycosyltransferase involved in cell wall biosynthesis